MCKLQSPSTTSPFDKNTYRDVFSTVQNSFWTYQCWCLLVLLAFFVSSLPHQQNLSLCGLFHLGKQSNKKATWGEIWWTGRVGHRGHADSSQKVPNTQRSVGRCTQVEITHHEMGKHVERVFKKKFTEAEHSPSQQHQLYTDTDGFLEDSSSGGSLYYKGPTLWKIIPFWEGPPWMSEIICS